MWTLAALAFGTWYWMIALHLRLRRTAGRCDIDAYLRSLASRAREGPPSDELVAGAPVALRRILSRLARAGGDPARARAAADEAASAELAPLERELGVLRAMVVAAPLMGLLGTVTGMIATFAALAGHGSTSTELLSEGVSEALVTTQAGLVVALPGVFGASIMRRRIDEVGLALDRALSHLAGADGRAPASSVAGARTGGEP
jgi:biopolymer transport protein ExbB